MFSPHNIQPGPSRLKEHIEKEISHGAQIPTLCWVVFVFLLPLLTHLGTVLLPQGRDESLHGLVLDRDLINVQIHVIPQPQLLQLLKTPAKQNQDGQARGEQRIYSCRVWWHSEGQIPVYTRLYNLINSTCSQFTANKIKQNRDGNNKGISPPVWRVSPTEPFVWLWCVRNKEINI